MTEEDKEEGFIEELIECPFCGGFVPNEFECSLCGYELVELEIDGRTKFTCSNCRAEVDEERDECPSCGTLFVL